MHPDTAKNLTTLRAREDEITRCRTAVLNAAWAFVASAPYGFDGVHLCDEDWPALRDAVRALEAAEKEATP